MMNRFLFYLLFIFLVTTSHAFLVTTSHAAMPPGAVLYFEPGVPVPGSIPLGSYFQPEVAPGIDVWVTIAPHDGLALNLIQTPAGSHAGPPDGTEFPTVDSPWEFFGNTGMHGTSSNPVSVINDSGTGIVELDFSGWMMDWNGFVIELGSGAFSGNPEGVAEVQCANTCEDNDTFTLQYSATAPPGDPSGFGGVPYYLYLTGVIHDAMPLVSGIWSGSPAVAGDTISLFVFGENFGTDPGDTQVFINGIQQFLVQVVTSEMLIARVTVTPAMLGGPVTVTTAHGSADSTTSFGETLTGVNITGFHFGTASVGDFVFVFGSGFALPISVTIGATPVPLVQVVTEDMFIMMVPPGASTGPVSVTTPAGSATSSEDLIIVP